MVAVVLATIHACRHEAALTTIVQTSIASTVPEARVCHKSYICCNAWAERFVWLHVGPSALFGCTLSRIQTEAVGTEYLDLSFTSWLFCLSGSVLDYEWFTSLTSQVKRLGVLLCRRAATLEHTRGHLTTMMRTFRADCRAMIQLTRWR
jgi:hypothetical protein